MTKTLPPLPKYMVAPTGARRTKADHPALPITIDEIVKTARDCWNVGADSLHAHVRDEKGEHTLDPGLYRELIAEMSVALPDMYLQITTEAVGRYSPSEQRQIVRDVKPKAVSISIREMLSAGKTPEITAFYHEQFDQGVAVQHILYSDEDVLMMRELCRRKVIPAQSLQLLVVLGRYTSGQHSSPDALMPFITAMQLLGADIGYMPDWACCAFGIEETICLKKAMDLGGKIRIGFENNLLQETGALARDNAERVESFLAHVKSKPALT